MIETYAMEECALTTGRTADGTLLWPCNANIKPGVRVFHVQDIRSDGIVIAVLNDTIAVLWSRPPQVTLESEMSRQITLEIDREIINDMTALAKKLTKVKK